MHLLAVFLLVGSTFRFLQTQTNRLIGLCLRRGKRLAPRSLVGTKFCCGDLQSTIGGRLFPFSLTNKFVDRGIKGWIITYIITKRQGGPSSGYISSGFYGGLIIGRVALQWVNRLVCFILKLNLLVFMSLQVGEHRALYFYAILTIALELVVWLVSSLIGNGVAISIIGVLLGPFYPIAMNHASRILPRWLLSGAMGWIAGFGQAGSALGPFVTGALASGYGISALQPL